jgi:hypothetical protein
MQGAPKNRGVSLIETMIAVLVAMIAIVSLGNVVFQATATNKNQGTETTRAVVYAQDKIEKLLSIGATAAGWTACTQSASTQYAQTGQPCNMTGVSDSGWTVGLLQGGPISSSAITTTPVAPDCPGVPTVDKGYVDFLNANGLQIGGTCSSITGTQIAYIREWSIVDVTTGFTGGAAMKRITVAVYSNLGVNTGGGKPIVVLTSALSNPN